MFSKETITEQTAFVKAQIEFHLERVERFDDKDFRKKKHIETANKFKSLLKCLENVPLDQEDSSNERLFLKSEDIEDLPEELLEELSISKADKTEFAILEIFGEQNRIMMSLDQIMIALYKKNKEIVKRTALTNRLYRMCSKELMYSMPGKKGIYSIKSDNIDNEIKDA